MPRSNNAENMPFQRLFTAETRRVARKVEILLDRKVVKPLFENFPFLYHWEELKAGLKNWVEIQYAKTLILNEKAEGLDLSIREWDLWIAKSTWELDAWTSIKAQLRTIDLGIYFNCRPVLRLLRGFKRRVDLIILHMRNTKINLREAKRRKEAALSILQEQN